MPKILSVQTALPKHMVPQDVAQAVARDTYRGHRGLERLTGVFETCGVQRRYFLFPPDHYRKDRGFEERNAEFIRHGAALGEEAARRCLAAAEVRPDQVDRLILVTTTGLATPSLDALIAPRLGLRRTVRRSPLFGLGCAGGAAALSHAAEAARADPGARILVLSIETSSQIFSTRAMEPVDVVGASLFGDGAAAALVAGDGAGGTGPRIVRSESVLFPESAHLMGWQFTSDGMRLRLSPEVPALVRGPLVEELDRFLRGSELGRNNIHHWILHPGGRKILESYLEAFGLAEEALEGSRSSLARVGNLSSASVLFILGDLLASGRPRASDRGILGGLGPGFGAEFVLLEW